MVLCRETTSRPRVRKEVTRHADAGRIHPGGCPVAQRRERTAGTITDLLLKHEGGDPSNERARPLAWVLVHRPQVYVAGLLPKSPPCRFICQVPEGQYDYQGRAAVTAAMTQAVAEAEGGRLAASRASRVRLHLRGPGRLVGPGGGEDSQARRHLRAGLAAQARRGWAASRNGGAGARCAPATGGRKVSRRRGRPNPRG